MARLLRFAAILTVLLLIIEYTFAAFVLWCYSDGSAPEYRSEIPTVYDVPARTLIINEATGASWYEYSDGAIEILTEGSE